MQSKEDIKKWLILRLKKSLPTFESIDTDFKKAEDIGNSFLETVSAYTNTNGGWLILGIHEKDGKLKYIGIEKPQAMENKIIDKLEKEFNLKLLSCSLVSIENFEGYENPIIFVQINKVTDSLYRPCYIKSRGERNGSFVRISQRDHKMSVEEIDMLVRERERVRGNLPPAELVPIAQAEIEDFDITKIKEFIKEYNANFKIPVKIEDAREFLKESSFIDKNNIPTLLGLLWFAKNPFSLIQANAQVYCRIQREHIDQPLLDKEYIRGTVLELISKTRKYVSEKMNVKRIIKKGDSIDIPDYPDDVLKEVIVNAVAHRDYDKRNYNNHISVALFKNKIEITNPGSLNPDLYSENYIFPSSKPKNPHLFSFLTKFEAENIGKGFTTLLHKCLNNEIGFPYFDISSSGDVKVIIPKGELLDESVENWLNFKRHFFEKKGFDRLDKRLKTVLAYFYKRDQRVKEGKFVINITAETNCLEQLSKLENANLIIPRQIASSKVYFLNKDLQEKTFEDKLEKIFGSNWNKLKAENKRILNMIYEFSENNKAPLPARQIAQILYPNYIDDKEFHDKYYGKIKRLCLTMEKYGLINRRDPVSSPHGGYWINKKFKQITKNIKNFTGIQEKLSKDFE
ncbi:putative DNA binding domain-containing protein [Candidatus Parcubacteria bacterium]|nr:putative DNA binding domain-containing protein [Candidatus Parcubacteria bacterium]